MHPAAPDLERYPAAEERRLRPNQAEVRCQVEAL
jgi:hypothetical protein